MDGILGVHELHVWQLDEKRNIGTVHILSDVEKDFMKMAFQIKAIMHRYGIHNSTIQPEFVTAPEIQSCAIKCSEVGCQKRICCSS